MGCDGGTIPRRDELVKVKKKAEVKDKDSQLAFQWRCCHLSQQPLQPPIVMCGLGHLYNKLALIEGLLNRQTLPESARHVKSLKDVKDLKLTANPEYNPEDEKKDGGVDPRAAPYICPVIGMEMTGKYRFVALWACGCVFSERALKEISTNVCHKCQAPFDSEDVVIINGNEEDATVLRFNLEQRLQKNKKNKPKKIKVEPATPVHSSNETSTVSAEKQSKQILQTDGKASASTTQVKNVPSSSSTTHPAATSITQPINDKVGGRLSIKRPGTAESLKDRAKKVKKDYSVAKDPQASDVYKSLFTSHQSEQQQNRAHWITYNPFYN